MQSVPSKAALKPTCMRTLKVGQDLEPEKLIVWLADHGYNRLEQVEVPGDFAVRGGIVDVYLPGEHPESGDQVGLPVRIDFFGDNVESIKVFDLDSLGSKADAEIGADRRPQRQSRRQRHDASVQLSQARHDCRAVGPAGDRRAGQELSGPAAGSGEGDLPAERGVEKHRAVFAGGVEPVRSGDDDDAVAGRRPKAVPHVRLPVGSLQKFETEAKKAIGELAELASTHQVVVFCENDGETTRFKELVETEQPGCWRKLEIAIGVSAPGVCLG